jgi:hypothetical protein
MSKERTRKHTKKRKHSHKLPLILGSVVLLVLMGSFGLTHHIRANAPDKPIAVITVDPNFGIKNRVIEFFEANDAAEMIPIIKCESRFRHYEPDGTPLMNREGSSATGVAQIIASLHPDPKVLIVHNKRHDMDLAVSDFDITTFEGNIGYALVLYQVRGTRDWKCSQKSRFQ